jgi:hypothetical protein
MCLQEPKRIILGQTEVFRRKNGIIRQVQSNDEAHYIPLLESLKNLLSDEFILNEVVENNWVVPEKFHTPPTEEISAVGRGRGEKIVSDNSKCIRTSEGGRRVNFLFPPMDVFWNDPLH